MDWLFVAGSEDWKQVSDWPYQAIAPSPPWNKTTEPESASPDGTGQTSKPSPPESSREASTSSPQGSPASPSAAQANAWAPKTLAGSGPLPTTPFARYSPDSYSWRTCQPSLFTDSQPYSETWPSSGSMRNGVCFRREQTEPHISDKGSSFLLPTLTVHGNNNRKGLTKKSGDGLQTALGGPMNPTWLEWFMGFPIGRTGTVYLGTPSCRTPQHEHSPLFTGGSDNGSVD